MEKINFRAYLLTIHLREGYNSAADGKIYQVNYYNLDVRKVLDTNTQTTQVVY